jgi:Fe-S cluster assembly protein SufD
MIGSPNVPVTNMKAEIMSQLSTESQKAFSSVTKRFNERFAGESTVDSSVTNGISAQFHQVADSERASMFLSHIGEDSQKALSPYHLVYLNKDSHLELSEDFVVQTNKESAVNSYIDIHLAEGATLNYYQLQDNSNTVLQTSNVRIIQGRNSVVKTWSVQTGSKAAKSSFFVGLDGEEAQFHYRALSMVRPDQQLDQQLYLDHAVPNCLSRQLFKGIVSERGRSIFNGRIVVRKYAQKTDAGQLSKNLLLGRGAEAKAQPQLEIHADDVKCAHGSTIGRLNKEELFYLQSRALSIEQSVSLLCHGYAEDVVQNMPNELFKKKFLQALAKSFETLTIGELGG